MLAFGTSALRINRKRAANQVLAIVCFASVAMFTFQLIARYQGARYAVDHISNPMPWVRLRFACIGFLCPFMVWTCYYVLSGRFTSARDLARKLAPWAAISLFLVVVPFTEAFKSSASRPDRILDGPLYTVYFATMVACELAVCVASIVVAPRLTGIRRLEFSFITIAFGYLSLAAIATALIHNFFRTPALLWLNQTLAVLVFLVFGISAWSVTSRRVYHSSQVLLPLAERIVVAGVIGALTIVGLRWIGTGPNPWPAISLVGFACVGFYYLDDKLRGVLNLKSEQRTAEVTRQLQQAATSETDPAQLITKLESVLHVHVGSEVRILTPEADHYERADFILGAHELLKTPLLTDGWISTASLSRGTNTEAAEALHRRLERESIHLLVSARGSENEPGIIVAFGERENGLPFTYPEMKMLRSLSDVVDGRYTRSRFSLQAKQAEQLAAIGMVGAGLAHELRNPIVAIETFAQLLPQRLDDERFLAEFAEVIPGEAKRIQALTEQLLDLTRPRAYEFVSLDLDKLIAESLLLLTPKARAARVHLEFQSLSPGRSIVADPRALRQVMLNLVLNSIQSIAQTGREGSVVVRVIEGDRDLVIGIEDNGPGIPVAIRTRLFRPFASAGKANGLGLGLAICAEIAKVHHGKISAEPHEGGARFRLVLPIAGPSARTSDAMTDNPQFVPHPASTRKTQKEKFHGVG